MAFDRAGVASETYTLPTVQPMAPQGGGQPFDDGVKALEGLQYVKGQTADYYRKVQALKSFMQDAHANLGLDVRVPDMSRPESIKLHQIYSDAISDILQQGNTLKQGQAAQTLNSQMNFQYRPGVDPTAQPVSTLVQGQDFYSRQLEPTVVEINNKLQMPSQTQEEQDQKEQIYKDSLAHYDSLIKSNPERKDYYEYQKAGLTPPTKGMFRPQNQYTYQDRAYDKKVEAAGSILTKIAHISKGAHESFQPDPNKLNPEGIPYLFSKEFYGKKVGDDIMTGFRMDPTPDENGDHEVWMTFKKGPPVNVSDQDPQGLAGIIAGVSPEHIEAWIEKHDKMGEYGQTDLNKIYGKNYQELIDRNKTKADQESRSTGPAVDELKSELDNMDWHMFKKNDSKAFGPLQVRMDGSEYVVTNIDKIPAPGKTPKEQQAWRSAHKVFKTDETGKKELIDFIVMLGGHVDSYKERHKGERVQPTGTENAPNTTGVINKGGKKLPQ